ncbi:MAG: PTS sugar transporter subunit IIA [Candidatus Poribacteria bacterium]|nr:PTS sugar transporter subunit IIA [Candidatus Poribacteria bacterium]
MTLREILSGNVIVELEGQNKPAILEELVNELEVGDKITDRDKVLQAIWEREVLLSTGIGNGIAIPHGKSENVTVLSGVLGIKSEGINFDSLDGKKTYIFFLLVSPLDVSGPHIKAFARISRILKGENFRQRLIGIRNREEALAIIEAEEGRLAESGGDQVGSFVETSSQ